MRQIFLTLILALGIATNLFGSDTLYFDTSYEYTQQDVDSIIQNDLILESNYEIFGQILESNNLDGWEWYYFREGRASYYKLAFEKAKGSLEKSLSYLERSNEQMTDIDYKCRIDVNISMGYVLQQMRLNKEAIVAFQHALDDTKYYESDKKSFILAGIAGNHFFLGNDSIAHVLILQVSKDTTYMNIPSSGIFVWNTLATLNQDLGNEGAVIEYFKKGLALGERTGFHSYDQSLCMNLVDIYWANENIDSVKYYLKRAAESYENYNQLQRPYKAEYHKKALGTLKVFDGKIDEGIKLIQEIVDTVVFKGVANKSDKVMIGGCYSVLSYAFSKQGKHDEALNALKKKNELEKWFSEYQLKEQLQKLEIEYQAKEKDQSISSLTTQTVEQSATISKQRTQVLLSLVLASLLGLIGFLVYRQRGLKAKYKETNLQQRLLRTQMDPHFVYNSLNSVSSLVYQKSDMAIPYISKLASLLRLILENSREELVPLEDEITALDSYLSLESNFGNSFKYSIDTGDMETDAFLAPPMLIQPFVENAIKHGFKGIEDPEIKLSISRNATTNLLEVMIVDNGIGISQAQKNKKHQSVSTSIVRERLAIFGEQHKVNTKLEISDLPDQSGTKVFMTIPYFSNN